MAEVVVIELSFRPEDVGPQRYAVLPRIEPGERSILDRWRDFYRRQGTPYLVVRVERANRCYRYRMYIQETEALGAASA